MGLLKAALAAGGSVLADQWKEFFYCDSIPAGTMMVKASKRTGKKSSNTKGSEDIITNGSVIAVADGQAMIIVDQGRVVEICAEPGEYTYDTSTEPSIFSGGLGHGIVESFKTFGKRVSFGGDTAHVQRVYYFNLKEMMDNKFGTQTPVPFRVSYPEIGRSFTAGIRCNGNYTYRIIDPILFYTNVVGNTASDYGRNSALEQQMKAELLDALQPAFAAVSDMGIRYDQIALHNREVKDELNKALAKDWREKRGLELGNITFNSATMSKEDEDRIKKYEDLAWAANPMNAGAVLTDAQAEAMKTAAGNQGGAMMGFMGMGMAQQAGGMNAQNLFAMGQQQQMMQQQQMQQQAPAPAPAPAPAAKPAADSWTCSCGTVNTAKFCSECGSPKPAPVAADGWTCACGAVNKGKFCSECGAKKPAGAPLYKCDKCGWEPADPTKPPKFCPECGDPFDDSDIK